MLFRSIGYEPLTIPNVLVTSGKEVELNVKLQESVTEMEEVVVQAEGEKGETINQMTIISARSFSVEESKRYAGSFDDPARMAQAYAGVASSNDASNEIVIRGNSPRGLLWRMEGVEIPNPNHFSDQGSSGGAISMLSSNMMTNSDFFTGAFPAEYGNALSGVFDIHLRKGNSDRREYAFQLGVLGTDIALEGPFKKGYTGSYLFNYRYSTLSLFNKVGINLAGDAVPVFQDLCLNVVLPAGKAGTFTLFGLGGNSLVKDDWKSDSLHFQDKFSVWMGVGGITHTLFLNSTTYLKTIVSLSGSANQYFSQVFDTLGNYRYDEYDQNNRQNAVRASVTLTKKSGPKHLFRMGMIGTKQSFNFRDRFYDQPTDAMIVYLDQKGNSGYVQGFFNWKYRPKEKWTMMSGVHYLHFLLNNRFALEPRFGLKYDIRPGTSLQLGAGLHSRMEDLSVYQAGLDLPGGARHLPNKDLGFTRTIHFVAGYSQMVRENLQVRPEIYFQHLFDVPIIDKPNSYFSAINFGSGYTLDTLSNKGSGRNIGLDLTVERFFADRWFLLFTGSLYQSTYIAGDQKRYNTRYNGNFANSFALGKEWNVGKSSKRNILSVSMRGTYAGGRRYTPILLAESVLAGRELADQSRVFSSRLKDYFRADLQISYKRNNKKTTSTWKIDAQNVSNRQNIFQYYFDVKTGDIRTIYQLGFVPVISYKLEF